MASESQRFGLGSLVSNRFTSADPAVAQDKVETYSGVGDGGRPLITEDVEIKGELAFSGELEFNGRFEGNIESDGSLIVGDRAIIKGGVRAETAVIAGKIQGNIEISGRVHLRPEAAIYGDIRAGVVIIDEGASVEGKIVTTQAVNSRPDFGTMFSRLTAGKGRSGRGNGGISSSSIVTE